MRTLRPVVLALLVTCVTACAAPSQQPDPAVFAFERGGGTPAAAGWGGGPPATLFLDSVTVHGGRYAGRIERDSASGQQFSSFTLELPRTFAGDSVALRGWLRSESVEGFVAIWMRQDGAAGPVQFASTQPLAVSGTTEWTEYRIALPVDSRARSLTLGALLGGTGTMWVDDLELTVDGRPASEVAATPVEVAASELDREFDRGSRVEARTLSDVQVRNLALLGRVWGFAKYHHPRVTAGELNWDYELFRAIPAVLEAGTPEAANEAISRWLAGFGDLEACTDCHSPLPSEDVHLAADLTLLEDNGIDPVLRGQLQRIFQNRPRDGGQYYVALTPGIGNPDFSAEVAYDAALMEDAGYRLLTLFRFWNIIEYWFPYRDLIDGSWEATLEDFIPEVIAHQDPDEFKLELLRLIARVSDTHANLWSQLDLRPPRGSAQLPVVMRFIEDQAVVTGYIHPELGPASGLLPGDVILEIDGQRVDSLVEAWKPFYAASNEPTRLRDIGRSMTRGDQGPVRLAVLRDGTRLELTPQRVPSAQFDRMAGIWHDLPGEPFQMLSDEVAYLKLSSVIASSAASYIERAAGAKVLVIDIRNYPSEFVVFALGSHLVARNTDFARFAVADPANPGTFRLTPPLPLTPQGPHFAGKIVILVDEVSQSQSEYTTMAFRAAPEALVVGSTTAGADGNVSPIPLFAGMPAAISGIGVFYPDTTPTQRVGIVPDLEVRPTVEGIRQGRDEVLEAAVSHALGREFRLQR